MKWNEGREYALSAEVEEGRLVTGRKNKQFTVFLCCLVGLFGNFSLAAHAESWIEDELLKQMRDLCHSGQIRLSTCHCSPPKVVITRTTSP